MESERFWRERESRSLQLETYPQAIDFHATPAGEINVLEIRDQFAELPRQAFAESPLDPEEAYGRARTLGRAARILLDGEKADRWLLCGGADDRVTRSGLQRRWRAEAVMAAVGADFGGRFHDGAGRG